MIFSVLLSGAEAGGAEVGIGGAGVGGGADVGGLGASTETLLLSLDVPLVSWWLFSCGSGRVAERFASASLSEDGATGGAGGAPIGGPVVLTPPLTDSDLKNSSRLLCNWKNKRNKISDEVNLFQTSK